VQKTGITKKKNIGKQPWKGREKGLGKRSNGHLVVLEFKSGKMKFNLKAAITKILVRSYWICWVGMAILLTIWLLVRDGVLEIQLHDTYYVFGYKELVLFSGLYLGLAGLVYWVMARRKSLNLKKLTYWHLILSLLGLLVMVFLGVGIGALSNSDSVFLDGEISYTFLLLFFIGMVSVGLATLLLLINIGLGLVKK
jgi:hypothetical protein